MKTCQILPILSALVLASFRAEAENEVGFIEKFALAPDREAVLGELIPGSEEYYFFHALQFQNTVQKEKLESILAQWAKRFPDSPQRQMMENRAALLGYDSDPQATLNLLRERLHLQFNHQQEARDQKPDLPSVLDQARIARGVFEGEALRASDDLGGCDEDALEALVREKAALKPGQVRALLSRLNRPDVPNLLDLVAADLKSRESGGFGEFAIHRALLPEQLDDLAKRLPSLADNQEFVFTRMRKLAPGADADAEFDPAERVAWLDRAWAYASKLPPSFNSLKANLLYRRLQHDRSQGIYDEARFLEYLKLPRAVHYMNPKYLDAPEQERHAVDLDADFSEAMIIPAPIGNDEALVRDYFLHIFPKLDGKLGDRDANEILAPWTAFVRESWLKPVLAEAMITNGVGDPERWASLLSPAAFQALRDRVDVEFAATNPQFVSPGDDVNLDLFVKNAPKLIVKVYEINTLSFFLAQQRQLNTDLQLDGLVANHETTQDFTADTIGTNPFRRARRTFQFPELKGKRGAWVIEFIGGGKSSRALVRKGQFSLLQHIGPAGDMITVLDESHQPVKDAAVWLDGRKFVPDEKTGFILVPFTKQPGTKPVVLADASGEFATLASFEHHAEQYTLDAQFHVEREQLLGGREATLAVRVALRIGDAQISPDLLEDSKLTITSTTLDGVSTTAEVDSPKLDPAKDFTHTIQVPERLASLNVTLTGKIESLGKGGEKEELSASKAWELNGIDETDATNDAHLSRFGDNYVFELLGKNGEPVADQQVVFDFTHAGFTRQLTIPLRTDEKGRIILGPLDHLAHVEAHIPNGRAAGWPLADSGRTWANVIHAEAGEEIHVPWGGETAPGSYSLLEVRGGTFVSDRSANVAPEGGPGQKASFLDLKNLAPGDYSLLLRGGETHEITIRVTAGKPVQDWIESPNRSLEASDPAPLQIEDAQVENDNVVVHLANADKFTRVHVAATRFLPGEGLSALAGFERFDPGWSTPDKLPDLFAAGREIGDEYRYILERRYSKIFPGNMLARPGLLLDPWEVRSTDLQAQEMAAGESAGATGGARFGTNGAPSPAEQPPAQEQEAQILEGTNLDFLADAAPVLYNLAPDENGVVRIDRKALGDRQQIQVYAENLKDAVWRTLALPEKPTKFRDLRLARSLDPQKAFTEKSETTVLRAGESLTLDNILTSEIETYDSLASVHVLFTTLSGDARLAKFAWILQWPKLKDEEKQAKYSEFACHELNFFLARKDPAFFEKIVKPYLGNKKDRTFMDDYLLGNALGSYAEPWAFSRLNMAERCLLAQRLPNEAAATARHLRELWELLPPDPERQSFLFETALRGRALQAGEAGEFNAKKAEALDMLTAETKIAPSPPSSPSLAQANTYSGAVVRNFVERQLHAASLKDFAKKRAELGLNDANRLREITRPFFRALGPTKEWAENNYYQLPLAEQNADLIPINAFWRDYAAWDGKSPFVSPHIAEASRNFSEMMLALAVLDLPFEPPKHVTKSGNGQFTITAGGPLIAFHKEIKPAAPAKENSELLVSQNFYRQGDRYREEGNEKFDNYVTGEFLAGVVYGANIVVTNPSSSPQKLEVLLQIPQGALPVHGSKATDSKAVRIEPYTTQTFEYFFYFPMPGAQPFPHYPVNVARDERSAGAAKPFLFNVVRQLSRIDKASWDYVSQYGSDEDVFSFLDQNNIERLNLERVAWRARKSVDFFRRIIALLAKRHVYNDVLYSYAVVHNDTPALGEWLRHRDDFLSQCGPWLDSTLIRIDPIERRAYQHLEYSPLVNQRAHRLGAGNRIANPVFRAQYQSLLGILSYKPSLDAMDQMSVVYYLFLQDRVEEALARFHAIKPESLPTRVQYDYFRCYAAFYEEQLDEARNVARQYADYPVDRWRQLFADVSSQLDELEGKAAPPAKPGGKPDREAQQGELAATEPSFDFKVENLQIALTWKNLRQVTINYYLTDPEFLFSSSPFVTQDPGRFSIIKPTRTAIETLPEGKDALDLPLPQEFAKADVLVEILGAGQRKAQAYHANTLKLALSENYGRLEVREMGSGKPVGKAYVKVYARLGNGTIRFFKDGYTDLRGKFDYASLNSSESPAPLEQERDDSAAGENMNYKMLKPEELNQVERLAILIMSETDGALVREVNPPSE